MTLLDPYYASQAATSLLLVAAQDKHICADAHVALCAAIDALLGAYLSMPRTEANLKSHARALSSITSPVLRAMREGN